MTTGDGVSTTRLLDTAATVDVTDLADLGMWVDGALLRWPKKNVILLSGNLGAGKTTLVRIAIEKLSGHPVRVLSPSFTIHQSYPEVGVDHFDLYRFDQATPGQLNEIGYYEVLERSNGLCFIEWPEKSARPEDLQGNVSVSLAVLPDGTRRLSEKPI